MEGMFFFEDKRAGTLILVPVKRDGAVVGVACADTLDSTTGAELSGAEVRARCSALAGADKIAVQSGVRDAACPISTA